MAILDERLQKAKELVNSKLNQSARDGVITPNRMPDEVNIVADNKTMDITRNSNDFLTGEYLAKGLLTYATAGAVPRMVRESGLADEIFRQAKYSNNIIKGFYDKGMTGMDKLMLHF